MSWVSRRSTTRVEDMAYCMLGILSINLPLLYGEGERAFLRLQEELIRDSNDQTIFCWAFDDSAPPYWESILAPSPAAFKHSSRYERIAPLVTSTSTYSLTNAGLSIQLPLVPSPRGVFAILDVTDTLEREKDVAIPLSHLYDPAGQPLSDLWVRQLYPSAPISAFRLEAFSFPPARSRLFVNSKPQAWLPSGGPYSLWRRRGPQDASQGLLLAFDAPPSRIPVITTYPPHRLRLDCVIGVASGPAAFSGVEGVIVQLRKRGEEHDFGPSVSIFFGIKTVLDLESGNPHRQRSQGWVHKILPPIADSELQLAWERLQRDFRNVYNEAGPGRGVEVHVGDSIVTEEGHELLQVTIEVKDDARPRTHETGSMPGS